MSSWTPEREALADVVDLLGVLVRLNADKAPAIPPTRRPQMAAHRIAENEAKAAHRRLHARLYGKPYNEPETPEGG